MGPMRATRALDAGVASPDAAGGIFRSFAGLAGDHELMGDEAGAGVGLEHAVAQGISLGEVPVGLHLGLGDVGVGQGAGYLREAVQLAVVPLLDPTGVGVVEVAGVAEVEGDEWHEGVACHAGLYGVGSGDSR